MHDDKPTETSDSIKDNVVLIIKSSLIVSIVIGLTSVIYFAARDQPKSFPVIMPLESEPVPKSEPIKEIPPNITNQLKESL